MLSARGPAHAGLAAGRPAHPVLCVPLVAAVLEDLGDARRHLPVVPGRHLLVHVGIDGRHGGGGVADGGGGR